MGGRAGECSKPSSSFVIFRIKRTILLVDDEKNLVQLLRHALEQDGFKVISASDAEAGLKLFLKARPDLVVLDIALPEMDGLELLRFVRKEGEIPVILLSGKGEELDRILGLKLGANDYVVKPFSLGELQARVAACFRGPGHRGAGNAAASYEVSGIKIDLERHEVRVNGKAARFSPKEFAVLKLLIEANGKVLSRARLLKTVWGHDKDMEVGTRTVDQHIARVRAKLGPQARRIVTVPNFGYKLVR